jgi:hypothetical protein
MLTTTLTKEGKSAIIWDQSIIDEYISITPDGQKIMDMNVLGSNTFVVLEPWK